jgi:hypothetical protein
MAKISAKMEQLIFDSARELFARCRVNTLAQEPTPTGRNGHPARPTKSDRSAMKIAESSQ